MVFLSKLRPTDVRPELLIDREGEADWLEHSISAYLADRDPEQGQAFCILGPKGVGKSILTRKVLQKLKEIHAGTTVFVDVDCRGALRQRKVLKQIAEKVHAELARMQRYGSHSVSKELVANAAVVKTLAGFDEIERKQIYEYLTEYRLAANLGGKVTEFLSSEHKISFQRSKKEVVEGKVFFDDDNVREMLVLLLRDIRHHHQDLDIVIYLDNIDELDHEAYRQDATREEIRAHTLGLMQLWRAPVGLVLNMRTYYSSILLREVSKRRELSPLDATKLGEVLARRLAEEPPHVQKALAEAPWMTRKKELAKMASTPLSFLLWFEYLAERLSDSETRPMANLLTGFAETHSATISLDTLRRIAHAFGARGATLSRAQVLAACGDNEAVLSQAIRSQIVLPRDFWEPNEFTLDPELHFFLAPEPAEA